MRIDVQALTEFNVETDGHSVTLQVIDAMGSPVNLNLQVDQLGQLAMTLPSLIDAAIRRQYGDSSFRFTYPMEVLGWSSRPSIHRWSSSRCGPQTVSALVFRCLEARPGRWPIPLTSVCRPSWN